MTTPPAEPDAGTPAPPRKRRGWLWLAIAAPVVAAVVAGAFMLINRATATPTFNVTGEITAPATADGNGGCDATGGYSDISAGTAVIVQGPQGQTVATGALRAGQISDSSVCQFAFTVPGVPDNLASYSITISHRGVQVLTPAAAHQPVQLSLG